MGNGQELLYEPPAVPAWPRAAPDRAVALLVHEHWHCQELHAGMAC
jgi:hypothetical protein